MESSIDWLIIREVSHQTVNKAITHTLSYATEE